MKAKHLLLPALLASVVLVGIGTSSLNAMAPPPPPQAIEDVYVVQEHDTVWDLANVYSYDPFLWSEIVKLNPMLQEPGRITTRNGKTIVLIRPGEELYGLRELGVIPTPVAGITVTPPKEASTSWLTDEVLEQLLWALAALAIVLGACYLFYRSIVNRPAATSGPAQVRGGVDDVTSRERFEQMAAAQQFTILSQDAGFISGVMVVSYRDGRKLPRRLKNERAYRARVRFSDGHEEELYMLRACGNDLRFGSIHRYLMGEGFAFTHERVVEPAPIVAPAATAAPAVEEPAPVLEETKPSTDGRVTIEYRKATDTKPVMLRLQGTAVEDLTCEIDTDGITLRYTAPELPKAA